MNEKKDLRVVVLEGSPYNRGLIHGKTLKKEINELVGLWKADLEKSYKMKAEAFIVDFLKKTDFTKAIKKWTPELLEEVRGISEGAGLDFDTIYAFQLIDEIWANADDIAAEHCTSIGVNRRGDNPALVAQNMDIPVFYQGYQTLLHIKHCGSDLESFVLTAAGVIALNGMNSSAVAINCNTLNQLRYAREGLPVAFIVRGVLERRSLVEAERFIRSVNHASGQNYIIGGAEKALSLECSALKVVEYRPYPEADRTYHTNHPLANDDFSPRYLDRLHKQNKTVLEGEYYCYRFEAVEKRLRDRTKMIDLELIKDTLSSRDWETNPVSNSKTFACVIMVLTDNPTLYIAPGKPHLTPFMTFTFIG
ncbi:MAG: peptidase C45 [Blastocatellia bacterium]|nr:peptidase C45 [Blastocatellia bacterium]